MRKLATYEGVVENGHVTLPPEADIPENTRVYVLVPDADARRTYKVMSPRLAHPEQAKDFELQVIEDATDADV
ncbi:MAG TPA: hypothetical protein VEM96_14035 [Pyrinomonadaceae bacterium]|nr:hypothetical protein [Pyrinomonadaceae bacterium]HZF40593.1 hypothetical protein [Blastocatellia bacterium]